MYKFSNQTDDDISKDISKIAELILSEEFDIVGLQEVLNEAALNRLKTELGPRWGSVWDSPTSRSQQAAEGYAFLWNTQRFRPATSATRDELSGKGGSTGYTGRTFTPRIHGNYRLYGNAPLIRDPFYARFEAVNGWYEVRLINTHIVYDSVGAKQIRKRELSVLNEIYGQIEDKVYRNSRPAYTFLLGDYNLSLDDIGVKIPSGAGNGVIGFAVESQLRADRDGTFKTVCTVQDQPSTLRAKSRSDPDQPTFGFANNYDHFTYDKELSDSLSLSCQRVNTVERYWNNDFDLHRKEFSDHIPVKMEVEFK